VCAAQTQIVDFDEPWFWSCKQILSKMKF
jgi:hypothetical protein